MINIPLTSRCNVHSSVSRERKTIGLMTSRVVRHDFMMIYAIIQTKKSRNQNGHLNYVQSTVESSYKNQKKIITLKPSKNVTNNKSTSQFSCSSVDESYAMKSDKQKVLASKSHRDLYSCTRVSPVMMSYCKFSNLITENDVILNKKWSVMFTKNWDKEGAHYNTYSSMCEIQ